MADQTISERDGSLAAVSGATGFIGSAVVRQLCEQNRPVRALIEPGANTRNLDGLPNVERVTVDICDYQGVKDALAGCRAFYHLAAIYEVWVRDPTPVYRVNLEGTTAALLAALHAGTERVIYTSSIAAVGFRDDGAPSDEDDQFNLFDLANEYILTKYLSERQAMKFAEAGLPVVVVNPAFPFGAGDIGPTPTGRLILSILTGDMPAVGPGGFCAIDVDDVAQAHIAAEARGRIGERYILGNHNVTFNEFVRLVCEVSGSKPPWLRVPGLLERAAALGMEMWANHVSHTLPMATYKGAKYLEKCLYFNVTKARTELGMPCTPLAQSISKAMHYFRENEMV